jgi:UDP-N-acetylmuramoyl-tripeptide--D-alanyl-D-alanine ligase
MKVSQNLMKNAFLSIIYKILASYAKKVIDMHHPFVIAITGSVGKGSAKEAILQAMKDHFGAEDVRANYGSLNAEIGIPLTILGYKSLPNKFLWLPFLISAYFRTNEKKYPKYLILEMGVEHVGDIDYFTKMVTPDIVVITSVSGAHLMNFSSLSAYQAEKISLADKVRKDGVVIVNFDDNTLKSKFSASDVVSVGISMKNAQYHAEDIRVGLKGTDFRVVSLGQKISIKSKVIGKHLIYPFLFAYAIGQLFEIQSLQIKKSLEKISPVNGRMNFIEGKDGMMIIDDTYNASPVSVKAALDTLASIDYSTGRKIFIMGNMNEMGDVQKVMHQEIGEYARKKCDIAIFVGPNANYMAEGYNDGKTCYQYPNRIELITSLSKILKKSDLVLIKASQNKNFFEEVVKNIMKYPQDASKKLVRQSGFWLKKKNNNY